MTTKAKFIISDTHLGAGRYDAGNVLEDFISDTDFERWLRALVAESERDGVEMELIINGDFIEMLQVPALSSFDPTVDYPPDAYAPTREDAAVLKMCHVIAGHRTVFNALGAFISPGPPRRSVTINKGNHDPELYWPAVQDAIRQAVGATDARAELLTFPAVAVQREGIYVEHGNQYAESYNRYRNFAEPLDPEHPGELERVPGSRFVYECFNSLERERPWIDGVSPMTALIWYALRFDMPFALHALEVLLRSAPGIVIGEMGFRSVLPDQAVAAELLNEMTAPERKVEMTRRLETDDAFRASFYRRAGVALEAVGLGEQPASRALSEGRVDPLQIA
ncbi:MAG: hypothetical protein J7M34_08790, partial [Anaerolineae bacterium]|nr:hypothetical protein [Anaerolineae bacterium]